MGKKYKGPPVKTGYRLLKVGETILRGDLVADVEDHQGGWRPTVNAGSFYTKSDGDSGLIYCRKIAKPIVFQSPKVVWTPKKFPEMTIRTTKRQIRDHLELAIMELNDLGAKLVAAQNTITRLKKKVSK